MRKVNHLLLKNLHQLRIGQIVSALGFAVYIVCSALNSAESVQLAVLVLFSLIALWTMASVIFYPRARKKEEVSYNVVWGQGAVTIVLVACTVLTIRQMMGK